MHIKFDYFDRDIMSLQKPLEFCAGIIRTKPEHEILGVEFEKPHLNSFSLAKFLFNFFSEECVLHTSVVSSPVWSSTQDPFLMQIILEKIGLSMDNYIGTKVIFDDVSDCVALSFLHCSLLFGWDAVFYQENNGMLIFVSHDGEAFLYGFPNETVKNELPRENCRIISIGQ